MDSSANLCPNSSSAIQIGQVIIIAKRYHKYSIMQVCLKKRHLKCLNVLTNRDIYQSAFEHWYSDEKSRCTWQKKAIQNRNDSFYYPLLVNQTYYFPNLSIGCVVLVSSRQGVGIAASSCSSACAYLIVLKKVPFCLWLNWIFLDTQYGLWTFFYPTWYYSSVSSLEFFTK